MPDNEKIADFRICTKKCIGKILREKFSNLHERSAWKNFEKKDFRICTKEVHRKNFEGKIFESARKKCIRKTLQE